MNNASKITILAAQYAGNSPNSIISDFLAPGVFAAVFFVGLIIVVGIIISILVHFTDKKQPEIWKETQYDEREIKKENKKDVR